MIDMEDLSKAVADATHTPGPSFKVQSDEFDTIQLIAERAAKMDRQANGRRAMGVQHHRMNVTACHANGNPLRLDDLLAADDFNFAHDVFGIDRHICHETGKLLNFFSPRFSARAVLAKAGRA